MRQDIGNIRIPLPRPGDALFSQDARWILTAGPVFPGKDPALHAFARRRSAIASSTSSEAATATSAPVHHDLRSHHSLTLRPQSDSNCAFLGPRAAEILTTAPQVP
jgi:hypothetical protein